MLHISRSEARIDANSSVSSDKSGILNVSSVGAQKTKPQSNSQLNVKSFGLGLSAFGNKYKSLLKKVDQDQDQNDDQPSFNKNILSSGILAHLAKSGIISKIKKEKSKNSENLKPVRPPSASYNYDK